MAARILVVDDSPTILKVVSAILARHGFEAVTARDGLAGLEALGSGAPFDLVLLDFVMPRMNGYQFCRELRSSPKLKAVPVVLMSAKGDRIREQFVQQTAAVDAITKPFDARGLVAAVEGALERVRAGRAPLAPEGETMPEDSTFGDDEPRPSLLPKRLQHVALGEIVRFVSATVTPAILALPERERGSREALDRAIARAVGEGPLEGLLVALREASSAGSAEVLSGDLGVIPLPEVLQVLQMQRQTGHLHARSGDRATSLFVRDGQLELAQSATELSELRLGRQFVEQGVVSRAELEGVAAAARRAKRRLGDELVATLRISEQTRRDALVKQSSEIVYDLVRWQHGRFWFTRDGLSQDAKDASLGLVLANLVLEGFRRVDEWRRMEDRIVWDQVVVVDEAARHQVTSEMTRAEQLVLAAVDGKRTIDQVVTASELTRFDASRTVHQLLGARVLRALES